MKYASVKDWVVSPNSAKYDFVEDTIDDIYALKKYEGLDDILKKYFVYRAGLYKETHNDLLIKQVQPTVNSFVEKSKLYKTKDPDQYSVLLRQVYLHLWGYIYLNKYCNCSDTMTSAQILLNQCIKCLPKNNRDELNCIYENRNKDVKGTVNSTIALAACNQQTKFLDSISECIPEFCRFVALYHTIGNYSPIPEGFNVPRSNGGKKDFWDLTLMCIKEYFFESDIEKKKRIVSIDLLNNHKYSNSEIVIEWLNYFGNGKDGWKRFVEINLFQDFVDDKYEVIPFWDNHNIDNLKLPMDQKTLSSALTTICDLIESRGDRIVSIIKK